ncbi:YfbM family protein [Lacunisphaera limnophila]|nr:YfbM family protein [Lacunisphaera limnophila]
MITVLRRLDDDTIAKLLVHPKLIHQVLGEEDDEDEPAQPPGFLARLFGRPQPALPPITLERVTGDEVDLDKAWNAIHFMLTGAADETPHPLGFICSGGKTVGREEVGYGPARAFSSQETQTLAAALSPLTRDEFLARFNAPAMLAAKVYPDALWEPSRAGEQNELYVADNFDTLRNFLQAAALARQGFVIYVS